MAAGRARAGCRQARGEPVERGVCARSIEGGELFERIVDEDYQLTEVDTMVFVRQICDGILFMHKMQVLHLDLKVRSHVWSVGICSATLHPSLPHCTLSSRLTHRFNRFTEHVSHVGCDRRGEREATLGASSPELLGPVFGSG